MFSGCVKIYLNVTCVITLYTARAGKVNHRPFKEQTAVCSHLARFFPQKVNKWDVQAETGIHLLVSLIRLFGGKWYRKRLLAERSHLGNNNRGRSAPLVLGIAGFIAYAR
jgi:hypothetical protein